MPNYDPTEYSRWLRGCMPDAKEDASEINNEEDFIQRKLACEHAQKLCNEAIFSKGKVFT